MLDLTHLGIRISASFQYGLAENLPKGKSNQDLAGIAQLVEHDLAKVGVASSNLVSRSKFSGTNHTFHHQTNTDLANRVLV